MRVPSEGWRSARSRRHYPGATPPPPPPPPLPAPEAPAGRARRPVAAGRSPAAPSEARAPRPSLRDLWRLATEGVQWTPVYLGFLMYIFVATTYRVPIGDFSLGLAAVGLLVQRDALRFPPLLIWFAAFLVWATIGWAQSAYPDAVSDRLIELGKLWIIVLIAVNALRTRAQLRFFTLFFLACYALYPLRGAYFNYWLYNSSMSGRAIWNHMYANPNDLATLTLLALAICAGVLFTERERTVRTAALLGVGMLTLLVFMTQSRGGILALAVFALFSLKNSKRQQRMRMLVLFAAVAGVLAMFAPSSVWNRISALQNVTNTENLRTVDREGSAEQRYEIWKVARKIIREHPVFGVGLGTYSSAHHDYALGSEFNKTARGNRDTHSTYLNVIAETGYVGGAIFIGMFLTLAVHAERVRRRARAVMPRVAQQLLFLEIGLLAYFIAGVFGSYGHLNFTYIYAALLTSFVHVTEQELAGAYGGPRGAYVPGRRVGAPRLAGGHP
jgi:O-antigen ligase